MTSTEEIREQAAEWVIRSEMPDFPDRMAFKAWHDADPRHAMAFDKARRLWDELRQPDAVTWTPRPVAAPGSAGKMRHRASRRMIVGGIAASLIAMIGIGASDDFLIFLRADLRSSPGAHLSRTLADGSRLELDQRTAVAVKFTDSERRLVLLKGQLFVNAASVGTKEHRPFVVEAANGTIRAMGTSFNVNRLDDEVNVAAVTHRIAVRTNASSGVAPVILSPGQGLRYGEDGSTREHPVAPVLATAWRSGKLVLDQVTLAEACTALRRYSARPIRLWIRKDDPRQISGVFDASDIEGSLHLIARQHGLRLTKIPVLGFILT